MTPATVSAPIERPRRDDQVAPTSSFNGSLLAEPLRTDARIQEQIDAHWARCKRANPRLYDGPILLAESVRLTAGGLWADYRRATFSDFLWLRNGGSLGRPFVNVFGAAAVASSDGAVLLARMAPHTANPGNVYFPAGLPDLDDVAEGRVDIEGSIVRELKEETGLAPPVARPTDLRVAVFSGYQIACVRRFETALSRQELEALVMEHIQTDAEPELDSVVFVGRDDAPPAAVPRYVLDALPYVIG